MLRTWDNWNRYLDNNSKPLHGCIQFMVKDGNTVAPIYDVDGTALDNPILTDEFGRTQHQVCIDEDVVAYFYKYVSNGIWNTELDIDTSDVSKWALQYTSESDLYIDVDTEGRSTYSVLNIDELRTTLASDVTSIDGVKIVTLMGYNEAGDKEPVNYIWDAESTAADDGGAVIATDLLKGRWIMVCPTEHLDVRHYSVFPSDSQNMLDQSIAVSRALTYANAHGLRLFFDIKVDTQYYHYYKLTNITLNPLEQIDVAKGVYFIDDEVIIHSQQSNVFHGDPYFINADTTLYSNYAKASWNIKALNKSKIYEPATYIIDSTTSSVDVKSFNDWTVSVNQNISGYTFLQCNITSNSLISDSTITSCSIDGIGCLSTGNTLQNLTLTEKMFNGNTVAQQSVSGCIADLDDFTTKVNLWNYLHFLMQDMKDIDFKNVAIPTDFSINNQELGDRTYSNFIGTGTSHSFGESSVVHTYRFNNVSGNIRLLGNANNTYIFDNCNVTVSFADANKSFTITTKDSNIVFSNSLSASTIYAQNSDITLQDTCKSVSLRDSTLNGSGLTTDSFTSYSCILLEAVISKQSVVKDSQVNGVFTQTVRQLDSAITVNSKYDNTLSVTTQNIIDGYFDNNIFNAQLILTSNIATTLVRGLVIINNLSSVSNPVTVNGRASTIHAADDLHQYIYKNNTGTMSTDTEVTIDITRLGNPPWNYTDIQNCVGIPGKAIYSPIERNNDMYGVFATSLLYIDSQSTAQFNRTQYFADVNLFTIGTLNVHINVEVKVEDEAEYLASGSAGIDKIGGGMSNCDAILTSPRSQGYSFSYTDQYISYPYNIEWDFVTLTWRIKNIQIALGEPTYNEYEIRISQV